MIGVRSQCARKFFWLTCVHRDGFEADRRMQQHPSAVSSKTILQRKSTLTGSSDSLPKPSDVPHEESPSDAHVSSAVAADKAAMQAAASNSSYRPVRPAVATAPASGSSDRFPLRPRDSSDPDYDRHYGKYAPRNAVVPGAVSWPVLPVGGGYGIPAAGIPVGAPYEAMSPM
jgi:hypothetical protein